MSSPLEKPMHFNEIKEFLGMSSDFIYKELQSGRLHGYKLGGQWIVYPHDLQKYLEQLPSNRRKIRRNSNTASGSN